MSVMDRRSFFKVVATTGAAAAAGGRRVSKNQARQAIAAGPLAAQLQSHLAELPVELLRLLVPDVDRTLAELAAGA